MTHINTFNIAALKKFTTQKEPSQKEQHKLHKEDTPEHTPFSVGSEPDKTFLQKYMLF